MKERIFYLIRIYVFMVLMLMLAKPAFMLYHHANHPFTFGDVMQVIGHGITLDLSTALYLIIVPFLIILLSIWLWSWNGLYRLLKVYYVLAAFVLALAFVSDTSLYEFWGFKLDASVLPYLSTPKEAWSSFFSHSSSIRSWFGSPQCNGKGAVVSVRSATPEGVRGSMDYSSSVL